MSDDELIEIALYKILDKNVDNLSTCVRAWLKDENDGNYPDGETYTERLRRLTGELRAHCDEIEAYADKLNENISKQAGGNE